MQSVSEHRNFYLTLSAQLVQQNKDFTQALKDGKPHAELCAIHAGIQEIYNQISSLKETMIDS